MNTTLELYIDGNITTRAQTDDGFFTSYRSGLEMPFWRQPIKICGS